MWRSLKKLKIEPAIPLLGINPEKTTVQKDVCTLHGSTTHNSEDREATQNRYMIQWIITQPPKVVKLSNCSDADGPRESYKVK